MTLFYIYIGVMFVMSVASIVLYSYDKVAAGSGGMRIPVYVLLAPTSLGGAAGALISVLLYRHKTKKMQIKIPVVFCLILQILIGAALLILGLKEVLF